MTTRRLWLITTLCTGVEVVGVPLLALITTTVLLRTVGDVAVAVWLSAQSVVTAANLWSLGRNDLLLATLAEQAADGVDQRAIAAAALRRAERPGTWFAVAWGGLGGALIGWRSAMDSGSCWGLSLVCALAAWCRLRETMAISALRGVGAWQQAALLSAAARSGGAVLALACIAVGGPLAAALALQSAPGLLVRWMAVKGQALGVPAPDLAFRRGLPYFVQMLGNTTLHTLDRVIALPLLGIAGAARYGLVSQLTAPLYGVVWGSFIWLIDRHAAGGGDSPQVCEGVWRLVGWYLATIGALVIGWFLALQWLVPIGFGPSAPRLGDPDLTWALGAALGFSLAVPPYYLLFRHQGGRLTATLVAVGAIGWGLLLTIPQGLRSPAWFAETRAQAALLLLVSSWVAFGLWSKRRPTTEWGHTPANS